MHAPNPFDAIDICQEVKPRLRRMREQRRMQLEREAVEYLDKPNVIGAKLSYVSPENGEEQSLFDVGLTPGRVYGGYVEASRGVVVEGRRVGWGRFQTAYQPAGGPRYGDGKGHPGIDVAWELEDSGVKLHARVWILADYTPPAEWREGFRSAK